MSTPHGFDMFSPQPYEETGGAVPPSSESTPYVRGQA